MQTSLPTLPISEREFTANVIRVAHMYGWLIAHFRPARRADGSWVTPVQADGKGFPDLVLVRGERVLFVELKTDTGRLDRQQIVWLRALKACPGVETYVWQPHQLANEINRILAL